MTYLDTNRLRHLVADGQTLARETVLDLLTRVERQQDAELQKLALQKYPATAPRPAKDQALVYTEYLIGNGQHWNNNPILDVIQKQAQELAEQAARNGWTYDPTSLQLQIHPEDAGNRVRFTATATYQEQS